MSWSDALAFCEGMGGTLAQPRTAALSSQLNSVLLSHGLSKQRVWLGGKADADSVGTWRWLDGQVFWPSTSGEDTFAPWGEKLNSNANPAECLRTGAMNLEQSWGDQPCSAARQRFICQEIAPPPSPPPPPPPSWPPLTAAWTHIDFEPAAGLTSTGISTATAQIAGGGMITADAHSGVRAFYMDGSDDAMQFDTGSTKQSSWTFAMWVKLEPLSSNAQYFVDFRTTGPSDNGGIGSPVGGSGYWVLQRSGARTFFTVSVHSTGDGYGDVTYDVDLKYGVWEHWALVSDMSSSSAALKKVRCYRNGEQLFETGPENTGPNTAGMATIGTRYLDFDRQFGAGDYFLHATIDDVYYAQQALLEHHALSPACGDACGEACGRMRGCWCGVTMWRGRCVRHAETNHLLPPVATGALGGGDAAAVCDGMKDGLLLLRRHHPSGRRVEAHLSRSGERDMPLIHCRFKLHLIGCGK